MTQLTTAIMAVAVYPDRARITRSGKIAIEPGLHRLEVAELPIQLDPDSVRASARGTARARLLDVQVQKSFYVDTPADQVRQLESQLEALQDEIHSLDLKAELVGQDRLNLNALAGKAKVYAKALSAGKITLEQQINFFNGLRLRAEDLNTEQQYLTNHRRELERQQQKLKNELDQQRSSRPRERYTASVEVEVIKAGELAFELSYVITMAGWKPLYDLRLQEGQDQPILDIGYLAQVTQNTGESWENVTLSLSTARMALAGRVPELDPWYIGPMRPIPQPRSAMLPVAAVPAAYKAQGILSAEEAPRGAPAEEVEAEAVMAEVDVSGTAVTYQVPGLVSIPPDGTQHKVTVARFPLKPELDYVTAPRLVEAAYRRAKVNNDSQYTLLPGQVNLFIGDEFIGATRIDLIPPQGEFELYLGVDDHIKVERELKRRDMDKRILGGKRRILYGYEIELENLLPTQARITLHDQLPVARHENIKVKLELADPKPTEQTELNLLDWELSLAPKEKRVVRFDFSVEYPQEMEVVGLP